MDKAKIAVLVSGGGTGDHPTFMALTLAADALQEIGFRLIVTDISNFSELSNAVNAGTAEIFAPCPQVGSSNVWEDFMQK